jgi:hypothetical protein
MNRLPGIVELALPLILSIHKIKELGQAMFKSVRQLVVAVASLRIQRNTGK